MDRGRSIVPLEGPVAAHRLPATFGPVLIPGVLQGLGLLILTALCTGETTVHSGERPVAGETVILCRLCICCRMVLTLRPYLAFICRSSFCRRISFSSLIGPMGTLERKTTHIQAIITFLLIRFPQISADNQYTVFTLNMT